MTRTVFIGEVSDRTKIYDIVVNLICAVLQLQNQVQSIATLMRHAVIILKKRI